MERWRIAAAVVVVGLLAARCVASAEHVRLGVVADGEIWDGERFGAPGPDGVFDRVDAVDSGLLVQNGHTNGGVSRVALEFDLSPLPPEADVLSASLYLECCVRAGKSPYVLDVHGYAGDGTITLADAGASHLLATRDVVTLAWSVDVTGFVREIVDSPGDIAGFLVRAQQENVHWQDFSQAVFRASEYQYNESLRPALEIWYVPEPGGVLALGLASLVALRRRRRKRRPGRRMHG